ncbi:AAA family ATPase [Rhizobium leguminosarum]|uniref:AAA family ATPase n=1 Tax=Rhizobium leguminosarum TaxID=384 RepID=UPI0004B31ABF|nr:ATP-binding protein [Rhizobium leguminosarum]WFT88432.1 AAA family ATPase [Rhizobium leguminosarum]
MKFTSAELTGYASFASTGLLELGPGINFFVGQNNTGKSALLQSFRWPFQESRHRNAATSRNEQLAPSVQRAKIDFSGAELFRSWQRGGWDLNWHVAGPSENYKLAVSKFFRQEIWSASIQRQPAGNLLETPPIAVGQNPTTVWIRPSIDGPILLNQTGGTADFLLVVEARWREAVFYFDAQRYNVGRCEIHEPAVLLPNAANLPAVLMRMQGDQGDLFRSLVQHMRDIFPTARNLSISAKDGATQLEILVWPVVEQQYRELATPLDESGTGLSQVLAILTVAMTMENAVLVIDEISSFLHPAAAKALVRILESHYGGHQYIISTHSPDVLSACTPSTIHLVTKTDFTSTVTQIDVDNIGQLRALTSELGVSMTDVFASDRIIWVEGPTEELAFPYIFEETRADSSAERHQRAPQFTAVVATGDFTARRTRPDLIFDIYDRLSSAASVLSGAATFAFDAEELTATQMGDLTRRAKGRLLFLPRRMIECYLIHPAAISSVINLELDEEPVSFEAIEGFLTAHGGAASYKAASEWNGDWKNEKWLEKVDAANLLSDLFTNLSETRLTFSKRFHSFGILKEILANDRSHIEGLIEFVRKLVELSRKEVSR